MKNLFNLKSIDKQEIMAILSLAKEFKEGKKVDYSGKIMGLLFFENSTRTQYSFITAMAKMNIKFIDFSVTGSSIAKGETFYDTVKTFESFNLDGLVIRHSENEYYKQLENNIKIPIINAGDGTHSHPSQSLLDLFTIYEEFNAFEGINLMVVGDIKHSRVAHTNIEVMKRLGINVFVSCPKEFMDENMDYCYVDFNESLPKMDVVMLLRVQNERHGTLSKMSNDEYLNIYGLTSSKVKTMKEKSIIMHPAPFNRGVEIADDVVECSKSRIFKQMSNGVYVRQAIIERSLND